MKEINYIGETLWIGNIGQFLIVLSFVSVLFSCLCYYFSVRSKSSGTLRDSWAKLGRYGFWVHSISLLTIISLIFYAMVTHRYEYAYVFDHVSDDLPKRYILSAFWEGQEGSFMLWMFWHVVLGFILIYKFREWEGYTMTFMALSQVFLASMLLGVHIEIGDWAYRIGSNPMILLRDSFDAPLFNNADYLSLITGKGLNPLLQNYWNVIHPPITFLGFASTLLPFCFAMAGLWSGNHEKWLRPALNTALFSGAILGSGILMGAVWAYEALSFGGYWAWDPVENAVLVPWLIMIAGIHTNLIAKKTKFSIRITYFFYLISFLLIVYSTYLTRSGILGDTSAHAFTKMGLEGQLILFILTFLLIGIGAFLYRYRSIPAPKKEEDLSSREFWMFIGALVLLFSAVLIIVATSLPVYNAVMTYFDPAFVGNVIQDPEAHYNKYQLWIAIFVGILSSLTIFLRYKEASFKNRKVYLLKRLAIWSVLSVGLSLLLSMWIKLPTWPFMLLSFVGMLGIVSSLDYIWSVANKKLRASASAISHFGFGLMLIGILTSGLNSEHISTNPFVFKRLFNKEDVKEFVQLIRNKPMFLNGYWVNYKSDSLVGREIRHRIDFARIDENNKVVEKFTTYPTSVYSNDFTKIGANNPDTRHYLHKDIFTCVAGNPEVVKDVALAKQIEDSLKYITHQVLLGDTIVTEGGVSLIVDSYQFSPTHPEYDPNKYDMGFGLNIKAWNNRIDSLYDIRPAIALDGSLLYTFSEHINDLGIKVNIAESTFDRVLTSEDKLEYKGFTLQSQKEYSDQGYKFRLLGFENNLQDSHSYKKEDGDIPVAAKIEVSNSEGSKILEPIFFIRDSAPMNIKDYWVDNGLHLRFTEIDPAKEIFSFQYALDERNIQSASISVAENVPRNDYIILKAQIFPGINLLWIGCVMMMIGLFIGWYYKSFKS